MMEATASHRKKPFKFSNVITTISKFYTTVEDFWAQTTPLFVSTSTLYRLGKKLQGLKPLLQTLGKEVLGDISKRTKEAYALLCEKQIITLSNLTQNTTEEENRAFDRWQHLSHLEEKYLCQKVKLHWLAVGDRNNAYFHRSAQIRRMQNSIREVERPDQVQLTDLDDIKKEALRFFEDFLTKQPKDIEILSVNTLRELLSFRCSSEEHELLIKEVTAEEIQTVLFTMPSNKSPRPDGYTCEFFKAVWPIVGQDFIAAIL